MSKQRHDKGWKKRNSRRRPERPVTGTPWLARQLVERGIADPVILDKMQLPRSPEDAA